MSIEVNFARWLSNFKHKKQQKTVVVRKPKKSPRSRVPRVPRAPNYKLNTPRGFLLGVLSRKRFGIKYDELLRLVKPKIESEQLDCLLRALRRSDSIILRDGLYAIKYSGCKKSA